MFARSTIPGNAKASNRGTSNSTALTLSFYNLTANEVSPEALNDLWRHQPILHIS